MCWSARSVRHNGKVRLTAGSALPWLLGVADHVIADHRRVHKHRFAVLRAVGAGLESVHRALRHLDGPHSSLARRGECMRRRLVRLLAPRARCS